MDDTLIHDIIATPTYEEFLANARKNFKSKSRDELLNYLEENISNYEKKYQMTSSDFANRFENGEFENVDDHPDQELFWWWSDYKSFQKLVKTKES
jgi:hypothetical protein